MNIIVNPHGCSACYCRPDTTWERENKDIYISEGIDSIYWTPVMFARISKAGKCIQKKFASRYYDSFNFGILIYTGKGDIAFTSCADHTSLLPSPLYNPVVMENEENEFIFFKNGKAIFSSGCSKDALEESLCRASCTTETDICLCRSHFVPFCFWTDGLQLRQFHQALMRTEKYDKVN